ncbi:MAG: HAD family hydrolase [Phycisphaerae bacterium]|nr:HAD family hydrolase [Phycisphaerae bacterium]
MPRRNLDAPAAIKAVIFDLDGTITRPRLDFDAIRAELALPPKQPVLEAMAQMSPERCAAAEAVLERHEREAAEQSELHDGAHATLEGLRQRGIRTGLLTRNSRRSTDTVLAKHDLAFDFIRTREDGVTKPSGEPIEVICRVLRVSPARTLTVGDFLFDIQAGRAAGTRTALMIGEREAPPFADEADCVIRDLTEILAIVDGIAGATTTPTTKQSEP